MLKYVDELLELCNYFIEDNIDDDFESVDLSTDFECYPNTKEVFISIVALEGALHDFMNELLLRTDVNDISEFTWSFLHEVGHCQTDHLLGKRAKNHARNIKRKIERGSVPPLYYYTLADEKVATDWAIGFVERNYELVKAFDKNVLAILNTIYLENEIDLGA